MSEATRTPLLDVPPEAAHRVALLRDVPAGELLIHEIYLSVQGESTFAGLPCVFVRTTVCDSRCKWCDTPHAFTRGQRMTRAEVLAKALSFDCPVVEITGGEPLLQADVLPLMTELCDAGKTVLLETSGAHAVNEVDRRVHIILDLKCPDSGESHRNRWANLDVLKPTDEIKYVICDRPDFDWAVAHIRRHHLIGRVAILISPAYGQVDPTELAAWTLETRLPLRLQLQLHKQLWDPKARGV